MPGQPQPGGEDPHEFPEFEKGMRAVGKTVGDMLPPGVGFALFLFEFGGPGKPMTYIANSQREDMVTSVLEWVGWQDKEIVASALARLALQREKGPEG
jgi:hypothetical protein